MKQIILWLAWGICFLLSGCLRPPSMAAPLPTQILPSATFPAAETAAEIPAPTTVIYPTATQTDPVRIVFPPPPNPDWQVPFSQTDWPEANTYEDVYPSWVNNHTLVIHRFPYSSQFELGLDPKGEFTTSTLIEQNIVRCMSPHNRFWLEGSVHGVSIFRMSDDQLVSETSIKAFPGTYAPYCSDIQWKDDDSEIGLTEVQDAAGAKASMRLYRWKTNGASPVFQAEVSPVGRHAWSKDLAHFAVVTELREAPGQSVNTLIDLYTIPSGAIRHFRLKNIGWDYVSWLSDQVMGISSGNSYIYYLDMVSGERLFDFFNSYSANGFHQYPATSPNGRWVTVDQNLDIISKRYSLYDVQTHQKIELSQTPSAFLSFSGWKADSSILYLVNIPAKYNTAIDSPFPAGLIAYHPETRTHELLAPGAVRAFWSTDMRHAWILQNMTEKGGVYASYYDAASGEVSGEIYAQIRPIAGDPASDPGHLRLSWSTDNRHAALLDDQGNLYLLSEAHARLLAKNAPPRFSWSPDGRYLLSYSNEKVWMLNVSKLK